MYPADVVTAKPRGVFWVGLICAIMSGGFAIVAAILVPIEAWETWRYDHAAACSSQVSSGCRVRSVELVTDIETLKSSRGRGTYRLDLLGGQRLDVAGLPDVWRRNSHTRFAVEVERFDGHAFSASGLGVTVPVADSPDRLLTWMLPGLPAMAGLAWYSIRFAAAGKQARTGRQPWQPPMWLRWPRRVALALITGGVVTFLVVVYDPLITLRNVLIAEGATAIVGFAVVARYALRKPTIAANSPQPSSSTGDERVTPA
jgi:hypothetical protein